MKNRTFAQFLPFDNELLEYWRIYGSSVLNELLELKRLRTAEYNSLGIFRYDELMQSLSIKDRSILHILIIKDTTYNVNDFSWTMTVSL